MWNRKLWMAIIIGIGMLIAAACGDESGNGTRIDSEQATGPGSDQPSSDDAPPVSYPPATLVIYSTSGWNEDAFNERFGAIRDKFPQHSFEYIQSAQGTRYPDLIAANQPVDIIWESVANFLTGPIEYETAYDMTELIKKHNIDTGRLNSAMIHRIREMSGGGLYALPVLNNTLSLYYNRDLFDKFGEDDLRDGMTWDEVLQINSRLTRQADDVQYVGLSYSEGHYFTINPLGIPVVDENRQPTIAGGQWNPIYEALIRSAEATGYKEKMQALGKKLPNLNNFRVDLDAAMFAGLANMHMTQDLSGINWEVVQFPQYADHPGLYPQTYPTYFGVANISKYKDQAMDVIKYLISDEFQMIVARTGALPVVSSQEVLDVFAADTNFKDKNVRSAIYPQYAQSAAPTKYDGKVNGIYRQNLAGLVLGEVDLNTFLRNAEEAAKKAIEEMDSQ